MGMEIQKTAAAQQISSTRDVGNANAANETKGNVPVGEKSEATQLKEKVNDLVAEFDGLSGGIEDKKELKEMRKAFLSTIEDKKLRKAVRKELKAEEKAQKKAQKVAEKVFESIKKYPSFGRDAQNAGILKQLVARIKSLLIDKNAEIKEVQDKMNTTDSTELNREVDWSAPGPEDNYIKYIKLSDEDYERFSEIEEKRANGTANAQDFLDEFYISSKDRKLNERELVQKAKFFQDDITDPAEKEKFQKQIGDYIDKLKH